MNTSYTHEVIPGVLEKDWQEIEKKLHLIKTFSKKAHIDFIDGSFSTNQTFLDPAPFSKFTNELYLEAHLQVNEPINFLDGLSKSGFKKIIGNIEKLQSQEDFVAKAELFAEVGLGLNLGTDLSSLTISFEDLDCILLMSIPSNESGLKFDENSIEKIKTLRSKTTIPIEVDGGINDQTIVQAEDAGANLFVSTSFISGSENPAEQFYKLQRNLV